LKVFGKYKEMIRKYSNLNRSTFCNILEKILVITDYPANGKGKRKESGWRR
jgi:hypothetical protein